MNVEQTIRDFLIDKYQPAAIILTGSRASGLSTEHSDWDLSLFVDKTAQGGRHLVGDQMLDVDIIKLPVGDDYVLKSWVGPYKDMKILHDTGGLAEQVVASTNKARKAGPGALPAKELANRENRLRKSILKTQDTVAKPELAFYHISSIYWNMVIRYWFEVQQLWPLQVYEALPYIEEKDPEFYACLLIVSGNSSTKEKLAACKEMFGKLFNKAI